MKFLGLLCFMVILDFQASAQKCNLVPCNKTNISSAKSELAKQCLTSMQVAEITSTAAKICDPSDCPPECRKICKVDCCEERASKGAQLSTQENHLDFTPVKRLESRPSLQVKSYVTGAD